MACNKSNCGHDFINYRHGHHLNKNIKSRLGKNSVSKLQKTCARGSKTSAPQWVCKRCTMLNEGHVLVCGACETSKDYDPEEARNVCPMCTLVNEPGKNNCELCDTDLEEME
jgi:acetone carboxylase gamma subunit